MTHRKNQDPVKIRNYTQGSEKVLKIQRGPDEINGEDHRKSVDGGKRVQVL